jgi:diaminopimelate epimerase
MYRIPFAKMHASGNDFIIIDNRLGQVSGDVTAFVRKVCSGILGRRGRVMLIEESKEADFRWLFNPTGEAEMCGNAPAARPNCQPARHSRRNLSFETIAGIIRAEIKDDAVKVQLTKPFGYRPEVEIPIGGVSRRASFINTGVPHVVYLVDDIEAVDVIGDGSKTRYHDMFKPEGTNANFVKVADRDHMLIRTYERGVEGETLACGTGVTAAALVAGAKGLASSPVTLTTRGGNRLKVYFDWDGSEYDNVFLEGDAVLVYQGAIEEGALL